MGTAMCFTKKESKGGTKPESITDVEKLNRFLVYEKIETLYEFLPPEYKDECSKTNHIGILKSVQLFLDHTAQKQLEKNSFCFGSNVPSMTFGSPSNYSTPYLVSPQCSRSNIAVDGLARNKSNGDSRGSQKSRSLLSFKEYSAIIKISSPSGDNIKNYNAPSHQLLNRLSGHSRKSSENSLLTNPLQHLSVRPGSVSPNRLRRAEFNYGKF